MASRNGLEAVPTGGRCGWEWDADSPQTATTLRLRVPLPDTVQSISDVEVSLEGCAGGAERLLVRLPSDGSVLLSLPLPGLGEDSGELRASFGKKTRQLKVTVPIPRRSGCRASATEEERAARGGLATGVGAGVEGLRISDGVLAASPLEGGRGRSDATRVSEVGNSAAPPPSLASDPMNWIRLQLADRPANVCGGGGSATTGSGCSSGRHLIAQRALSAGELVLEDCALLAAVSDKYISSLCAACFHPLSTKTQKGCPTCEALLYCGEACLQADAAQHRAECVFLKAFYKQRPGGATGGMRLTLRVLWELEKRAVGGGGLPRGWDIFDMFQEVPFEAPPCEDETAPLAVFRKERVKTLQHELDTKAANMKRLMQNMSLTTEDIKSALAKLQANAIGICNAQGGNLGTGVYPLAWLFNHSCDPNMLLSFRGTKLHARAMREIVAGEALTIGYTELYETAEIRQRSLFAAKGFRCLCPRCEAHLQAGEGDGCIAAWSNPTRANSWLFHPNELSAMGWREEDGTSHDIDQNAIPVMTEQDVVWRERLAKGLAYLGQAREVGSSDGRHASALQQAQSALEKVLEESRGTLHPQHAIRFAAMKGAADAAKGLGDTEAAIRHARAALECIQEHCCAAHPGRAYLLNVLGEMTMKAGLSHARTNPMQAKLMLAGSCKQLKDATSSLGVGYGDDHPDVKALRRMLSTAEALLQRLKSSA